jgi:hypothetical protein
MAVTILEAAKLNGADTYLEGIVEQFSRTSPVLERIGVVNINGNSLSYNYEDALPGVAFRGVNETYTESTGVIAPKTEALKIAGGYLDVDRFIVRTMGEVQRTVQELLKVKSMSLYWTRKFFDGNSDLDPREFDGLKIRLTGPQVISNHATGAGLSLSKLDEAIDAVDNPQVIYCHPMLVRLMTAAARNVGLAGYITYDKDDFGRRITAYNGIPLVGVGKDNTNTDILTFSETGANTTSMYIVSHADGDVELMQNGDMSVEDLGMLKDQPKYRTMLEWYNSIIIRNGRGAARLQNITNAAVTA